MSETRLCAMVSAGGGPSLPHLSAVVVDREWSRGRVARVLVLVVGNDTVEVSMVGPEDVRALGEKLVTLAKEMER